MTLFAKIRYYYFYIPNFRYGMPGALKCLTRAAEKAFISTIELNTLLHELADYEKTN